MLESIPFKDYPVLFVDDEEMAVITFKNLYKDDFTIHTALNGEEALSVLKAHPEIALIATDQRMPKMTGLELLTQIAQKYPRMINILITAYSDLALVIEVVNKGNLFRYISKPYEEEFLKRTIIQGIERYHLLAVRERFFADNAEWAKKGKGGMR
jgi:DNA-binding NtrC family response regulator